MNIQMILSHLHHVVAIDKSSYFKFAEKLKDNLVGNNTELSLLCSTANPKPCTPQPKPAVVTKPTFTFLDNSDFCKYITYYDNNQFANAVDKMIYKRILDENPNELVNCKNKINCSVPVRKPEISNNTIIIKPEECKTNPVQTVTRILDNCSRTIIENGQTTVVSKPSNTCTSPSTTTTQVTITAPSTPITTTVSSTVMSTVVKPCFITVTQPPVISTIVQQRPPVADFQKPAPSKEIDSETLKNLTLLIKEMLSCKGKEKPKKEEPKSEEKEKEKEKPKKEPAKEVTSTKTTTQIKEVIKTKTQTKEVVKTVSDPGKKECSKVNKSSNVFKDLITELTGSKESHLLGMEYLKSKFKPNTPSRLCENETDTNCIELDDQMKADLKKELQKEIEKRGKEREENLRKQLKEKDDEIKAMKKPPVTKKQEVTTNDLVDELLVFINKDQRSEEDILKLLDLIALVKNNKKKGERYVRMNSTVTITVHKTVTVDRESRRKNRDPREKNRESKDKDRDPREKKKESKDKNRESSEQKQFKNTTSTNSIIAEPKTSSRNQLTVDSSIVQLISTVSPSSISTNTSTMEASKPVLVSSLDPSQAIMSQQPVQISTVKPNEPNETNKPTPETTSINDENKIINKIKKLLNIDQPKKYYGKTEIKKLQKEINEKDKEIKELQKKLTAKKVEGLEEENFEKLKKKLSKLADRRKKILNELAVQEHVSNDDIYRMTLDDVKNGAQNAEPEENTMTVTATRTIYAHDKEKKKLSKERMEQIKKKIEKELRNLDEPANQKQRATKDQDEKSTERIEQKQGEEKKVKLKSAEIKLRDTNANKNIKINIPIKEINDAITEVEKKKSNK